jgi:hypothetical protein
MREVMNLCSAGEGIPAFYEVRCISVIIRACCGPHLCTLFNIYFNVILLFMLSTSIWSLSFRLPVQNFVCRFPSPMHATWPDKSYFIDLSNNIWLWVQLTKCLITCFFQPARPVCLSLSLCHSHFVSFLWGCACTVRPELYFPKISFSQSLYFCCDHEWD